MENDAVFVNVKLVEINCGCCGGVYAINERYKNKCHDDGLAWTCPYCKTGWGYAGVGRAQKLEKELAAEKQARQAAESREALERSQRTAAQAAAKKANASLKRVKHRVTNGTCPCCQRSFVNLQRHMTTKHPDYESAAS